MLPKLKMHARSADALALSAGLGSGPAFFRSSSSSFFIGMLRKAPAMEQLAAKELEAAYCKKSLQQELAAAYCEEESLQKELGAAYLLDPTRVRELELPIAQLCKQDFATKSLQQNELGAAYAFQAQSLGPTRARELQNELAAAYGQTKARTAAATAAGKLQVAGNLCSPESIHYEPLPQIMQSYLALAVHDMHMDLRTVVQNNLARKREQKS